MTLDIAPGEPVGLGNTVGGEEKKHSTREFRREQGNVSGEQNKKKSTMHTVV